MKEQIIDERKDLNTDNSTAIPTDLVDKYGHLFHDDEQLQAVSDLIQQSYKSGIELAREEPSLFVVIPIEILEDNNLSSLAKLLYGGICGLTRRKGFCYATNKYLAGILGISERSVNKPLKELVDSIKVTVDIERSHKGTYRKIQLNFQVERGGQTSNDVGGVTQMTKGGNVKRRGQRINKQSINKQNSVAKKATTEEEDETNKKSIPFKGVDSLLEGNQRHVQIIGLYAKTKGVVLENKDQRDSFIKRNACAAVLLKGYSDERIKKVMDFLEETADFKWTLESAGKFIDEDLVKIDKRSLEEILNKY